MAVETRPARADDVPEIGRLVAAIAAYHESACEWFLSKGVTVVTLLVLHRNWSGSSAWYKLGYEDWTHERRLELKPRAK